MLPRFTQTALFLLLALAACQPAAPPTAVLSVDGPNVRLNGAPAKTGDRVAQGDQVSTGPGSAARIGWSVRTYMLIDESSDPLYHWTGPDGRTLAINVGIGWFLIDSGAWHISVDNVIATATIGSRAAINVVPGRYLDLYLLEGTAAVVRPAALRLASGQKVRITAGGSLIPGAIVPDERAAIEARFSRWDLPAISPPRPNFQEDRSSPQGRVDSPTAETGKGPEAEGGEGPDDRPTPFDGQTPDPGDGVTPDGGVNPDEGVTPGDGVPPDDPVLDGGEEPIVQ